MAVEKGVLIPLQKETMVWRTETPLRITGTTFHDGHQLSGATGTLTKDMEVASINGLGGLCRRRSDFS